MSNRSRMHSAIEWLEAIYGPFGEDARIDEVRLVAAEQRLEITLPAALRELYARTGASEPLHRSHNLLLPPEEVELVEEHLVFYEENQSVVAWGIPREELADADPRVEQGQREKGEKWTFYPEFDSVSEFACAQGAWQAVQAGLPFTGVVEEHLEAVPSSNPSLTTRGLRAWLVDGGVAIHIGEHYFGLATRTAAQFRAASKLLNIALDEWDYATVNEVN